MIINILLILFILSAFIRYLYPMKSLYIHIPFCKKKCIYCDFYSVHYQDKSADSYIDIICKQLKSLQDNFFTIYIGGGTPSVLDKKLLIKLLKSLRNLSSKCKEFTIEINPESINYDKLKLFCDEGVNRISIGVQSFNDDKLKKLTRLHTAKEGEKAVFLAKKAGFNNINIDLIFGVWEEDSFSWQKELKTAVEFEITHISTYALTCEKNTPLFKMSKNGEVDIQDDISADIYKWTMDFLPAKGFIHYEISNFSKAGFICKHNVNYWENGYYIGLGSSSVSYINGVRLHNVSDVKEYIERTKNNISTAVFKEKLSPLDRAKESAAIRIRTKDGIDFEKFKLNTGFDFIKLEQNSSEELRKDGLIKYKKKNHKPTGVCLTKKGFMFSDTVSSSFL